LSDRDRVLVQDVEVMVSKAAQDRRLARPVRQRAEELLPIAQSVPGLARQLLSELSDEVCPSLPRTPPTADLCRAVTVSTYFDHHLDPDVRAYYLDAYEYLAHLLSTDTATVARELQRDLSLREPLFPARHSWLVSCEDIGNLLGTGLKRALGVEADPPFVVFELSRTKMIAAGVTIRQSTALDAVPEWFLQWILPVCLPASQSTWMVMCHMPHSLESGG